MTDFHTIKYRLIGAAIIVISLVLSWWLFLDHDVRRYQNIQSAQPEPLAIERFDIAKPVKPPEPAVEEKNEVKEEEKAPVDKNVKPAAKPVTPYASVDDKGLPEAWVLQVASFQQPKNAEQLKDKLLAADMPAYVKKFKLESGVSYRVLVGPKLNRQRAEEMLKQVKQDFKLNGLIIRYKPGYEQ